MGLLLLEGLGRRGVLGGWLLEHFWWGSVLYINVPVAILAIAMTAAS